MLCLSGRAQVKKAAEKYQYVVWEILKCLDQHLVCHVDNQCHKSYTHAKNVKKANVSGFYICFTSPEQYIAATENEDNSFNKIVSDYMIAKFQKNQS